jgi:hypothetical protein
LPSLSQHSRLVNKESLDLVVRLAELLVLAHEHNLCNPGAQSGRNRESGRRAERNDVAGLVGLGPQVRSPICVVSDLGVGGGGSGESYQMKDAFITVVTMPMATAFFSGV